MKCSHAVAVAAATSCQLSFAPNKAFTLQFGSGLSVRLGSDPAVLGFRRLFYCSVSGWAQTFGSSKTECCVNVSATVPENHYQQIKQLKEFFLTRRTSGCCRAWGRPPGAPAAGDTAAHIPRWSRRSSRCRCGGRSSRSRPSWGSGLGGTEGGGHAAL